MPLFSKIIHPMKNSKFTDFQIKRLTCTAAIIGTWNSQLSAKRLSTQSYVGRIERGKQ